MAKKAFLMDEDSEFSQFLSQINLDRASPLRAQVYTALRQAIVDGKLLPKTNINEIAIADKLNISRTPVREAVKKLSDEGMITVVVQVGTFVSEISREQIEEAYIMRIALEVENISRAAEIITQSQIYDLEDIIDMQRAAVRRERYGQAIQVDDQFHRYITEINGFSTLWKIVDMTKAQMDRCRVGSIGDQQAGERAVQAHTEIVKALKTKDPSAARKAMLDHLEASQATTLKYIDRLVSNSS